MGAMAILSIASCYSYTEEDTEVAEDAAERTRSNRAVKIKNIFFCATPQVIKISPICLWRTVRNLFLLKEEIANCLCLKHLATADSLIAVARVSMMLLAIMDIQDVNHIPMGMMLLCAGVGYLSSWEYYQNSWGWGCTESGWGYTWAFNQLTWWDYNAYFRGSPSRIF